MGLYPQTPYGVGADASVLQCNRVADKNVDVKPDLPGTVIVIHGVNDLGVGFGEVESGLCQGLTQRTGQQLNPAPYSMPTAEDKGKVHEDPDAVFFKRRAQKGTHSPVIPFYWGFREEQDHRKLWSETSHGQATDRYGNRLDKDYAKGGGPFANATATLPDMWGRGKWAAAGVLDKLNADALRPVLNCPGRMYMILAARRLAALISMIRDYDPGESVSIVAHSQGCLISLLAQAFLLQDGLKPADTLVLTHPPYGLNDDNPWTSDLVEFRSAGRDALMNDRYDALEGLQTFHARVQTLVNIVHGVVREKNTTPAFASLNTPERCGVVSAQWKPEKDRDNRGKVYLYFCPEDMTVALEHVAGIGWQGIPDAMAGTQFHEPDGRRLLQRVPVLGKMAERRSVRQPLKELGPGFFQRVFTAKRRPDPSMGTFVRIGQAEPHDFPLRVDGEGNGFSHAADMTWTDGGRWARNKLDFAADQGGHSSAKLGSAEDVLDRREGWRTINGEPLPKPVIADMYAGSLSREELAKTDLPADKVAKAPIGSYEEVDPVDAAIATTSKHGSKLVWDLIEDPEASAYVARDQLKMSPERSKFDGVVSPSMFGLEAMTARLNEGQPRNRHTEVKEAYLCCDRKTLRPTGQVLVRRTETADEVRLRQQQRGFSQRSFHGAIFGSATNHRNVTAYDVSIGQGKAPSHPDFYRYLCAVADWRLKKPKETERPRPGILVWSEFLNQFGHYYNVEPDWRKRLIEGNMQYYSRGVLPACLPVLPEGLPAAVVCETRTRRTTGRPAPSPRVVAQSAEAQSVAVDPSASVIPGNEA